LPGHDPELVWKLALLCAAFGLEASRERGMTTNQMDLEKEYLQLDPGMFLNEGLLDIVAFFF